MAFRFNFTGRQRIGREDIDLRVSRGDHGNLQLLVGADLGKYQFPNNGLARLEANTDSSVWTAFAGTVGELGRGLLRGEPLTGRINEDALNSVQFTFKVIHPLDSRLLGVTAKRFRLDGGQEGFEPILETVSGDTGELPYAVNFNDGPELMVSNRLWDQAETLLADPLFRSVALPDILRRILINGLLETEANLLDETEGDGTRSWFDDWIDWMRTIPSLAGCVDELDHQADEEQVRRWIEDVVQEFASVNQHRFVSRLVSSLSAPA